MSLLDDTTTLLRHADQFFIGGAWINPSSGSMIDVTDSGTEKLLFRIAEAQAPDTAAAVTVPFLETKTIILEGRPSRYT